MTSKVCFKCLCEKPLNAFYVHSRMADGHLNKCKECTKKDSTENRNVNIERIRAYDKMRASMPHRVTQRKEIIKRWIANHPDRKKAAQQVSNAIRDKKLEKQPCHICGTHKSEAHHPDYSRPLDVVWLCRPHHMQAHAIAR